MPEVSARPSWASRPLPEVSKALASAPGKPPAELPSQSLILSPEERTGTHLAAAPESQQKTPQERMGEMVPESALPALSWMNRNIVQPPVKMGQAGAKAGGELLKGAAAVPDTAAIATGTPPAGAETSFPKVMEKAEAERPVEMGLAQGVGEMAGGTVADPRNWPFFGAAAARPLLQKLIGAGFSTQIGAQTLAGAKQLYDNWENLSPEQRAEIGASTGVGAILLGHGMMKTGGGYEAAPKGPESVFKSIVYNHTGVDLPEAPTLEQAAAAHRAAAFNLHPDVNPAHIEDMKNLNQAWDLYKQTLSPTPPPPPPRQPGEPPLALPGAPPPMHAISMEEIAEIGDKIAKLPVEERPQATLAAHTALATELLNQGKLTIDGKVEIVRNQKQAETLAQRLINEEIGRQDTQAKKAAAEPVPAPPAGFTLDEGAKEAGQPAQTFAVGDRVVLPKGDTGTVAHANSRLIRVALDGGGKASVPAEKWGQVGRAKVESGNAQ